MNEHYSELKNFLISYFGDYKEGKDDTAIIDEAVKENTQDYMSSIKDSIQDFAEEKRYSLADKFQFLSDTNIYFGNQQQAVKWLVKIKELITAKL